MKSRFSKSILADWKVLAICFSLGYIVRLIPELLAWPLPIGWDTVYYAFVIKSGVVWPDWSSFFTLSWLFNAFIVALHSLVQVDPFVILKIVAPLLFGLNVAGVYWFARKILGWNLRMSILAGAFFSLQLASLRIGWDLLRNTFGLGILLFTLVYSKKVNSRRGFAAFALLSFLCVFAHEYAATILFVSILGWGIWNLVRGRTDLVNKRIVLGVIPAAVLFLVGLVLRSFSVQPVTNVVETGDAVTARLGNLFFLVNYLQIQTPVDSYANYFELLSNVLLLFVVLFLPYFVLVLRGFFRNSILDSWTILLLVGAFGCLVVPFFALEYWQRWMFMLVYPFTFYSVNGLKKVSSEFCEGRTKLSSWLTKKKAMAMLFLTVGLGVSYLATPFLMTYSTTYSTSLPSLTFTSRYFSVSPSVPYKDVYSVEQASVWLDKNMTPDSAVILHHAFLFWGELYLKNSQAIVTFDFDADLAASKAFTMGYSKVFFLWWNTSPGWFEVSTPKGFKVVQSYDSISIYECEVDGS